MTTPLRRVLISQRVDPVPGRDETRDGLDIRFAGLLWQMGLVPVPLANGVPDPARYVAALNGDAVILSGGNDIGTMPSRDGTETALLDWAAASGAPVLAICRGLQMLNHYQGGRLDPVSGHVATRHRVQGTLVPEGRVVNSYHNQGIAADGLGRDLLPIAQAEDGGVEAVIHRSRPWLGMMWHPEREPVPDPQDLRLIRDHLWQTAALHDSLRNGEYT